jgi:hypothetical protein
MRPAFNPVKPRPPGTVKACVVDLFAQNGGPKRVMVKLDLGESQVYAFTDPQSPERISFERVAALTSEAAPAGAEFLAALAGGFFQPMPCAGRSGPQALTAESARQHGEAIAVLVSALADGRINEVEARNAMTEVDEALRALCGLRALLIEASGRPPD